MNVRMSFARDIFARIAVLFVWVGLIERFAIAEPPITALAVSSDGDRYITGSQAGIHILNSSNHELLGSLDTQLVHVHDLCWSADGNFLIAAGGSPAEYGAAEIYSWPSAERVRSLRIADDLIYRVHMLSEGNCLLTSGHENQCWMVSIDGRQRVSYAGHSRSVLAIRPLLSKGLFLSGGVDQTIQLWTEKGKHIRTLNNHTGSVTDLVMQEMQTTSGEGRLISTSEDRTVRLWQPEIGRMVRFVRLGSIPRRVVNLADGDLAVGCDDGTVIVIDPLEMKIVSTHQSQIKQIYELVRFREGVLVAGVGGVKSIEFGREK